MEIRLGIAGTAKNTGKTTTTAAIIDELRDRNIPFFLTSIGYDGENIDNITGLPKPKLRVEPGDLVATAEKCLEVSTAGYKVLTPTNIRTPLGKISLVQVTKSGLAVTAGPNKSSEVRALAQLFRETGPGVMIFDGALNRIAPMVETDGFVLATGAARTPDIPRLAEETELVWRIASLPTVPKAARIAKYPPVVITLIDKELTELKSWPAASLIGEFEAQELADGLAAIVVPPDSYLYIPGIISEQALLVLCAYFQQYNWPIFLTFADPIKLLVSSNPVAYYTLLDKIFAAGGYVGVVKRVPLLAVTLNPFYPEYRFDSKTYQPAFVDFMRLQLLVQKNIQAPVYNVVKQGAKSLVDNILAGARRWEGPSTMYFNKENTACAEP
ncbi:hypothetical protein [Sporomusa malonica]|uniref:hypothetical protein n=1 Tax=Sporomusa malonica TaxID=112901 RepID=UPI00352AD349